MAPCERCGTAPYIGRYRSVLPAECPGCEASMCTSCSTGTRHAADPSCRCSWDEFCSVECRAKSSIICVKCHNWAPRMTCVFCGEDNPETWACYHLDCDGGVSYCSKTCADACSVRETLGRKAIG